ncbi:MAG: hypothetical protein RRA92_10660, partial [Gemmatimonadota bacterium]|nr:hypothetical protein [Gemmatimonadota bacterium]
DEDGAVRLEGETFVEARPGPGDRVARFAWRGDAWTVRVPPDVDGAFLQVRNLAGGRLWVVLRRRRSVWRRLAGPAARILADPLERRALPAPPAP